MPEPSNVKLGAGLGMRTARSFVLACSLTAESHGRTSTTKKGKGGRGEGGGEEQLHIDPEAGPELKEALEVRKGDTETMLDEWVD